MAYEIFSSNPAVSTPRQPYLIGGRVVTDSTAEVSRSGTATAASLTISAMADTTGLADADGVFISGATNKAWRHLNQVSTNVSASMFRPAMLNSEAVSVKKVLRIPIEFEAKYFKWTNLNTRECWEWQAGMPLNSAVMTTAAGVRTYHTEPSQGGDVADGMGIAVVGGAVYLMPDLTPVSSSFVFMALG